LPGRLSDPVILELGRRVEFAHAPDLQARFPPECLARVRVELRDGRTLDGPTIGARGDYTDPVTDAEMDAKYSRLAGRLLGGERAGRIAEVISTLEARPASDLLSLLRRGATA
jgi:2-methylcitrate dehydratase PrpD